MRCRIVFGFAALLAVIAASAIACSNFVLYDLFSGKKTVAPTAALALSPAAAEVYTSSTLNLVATGGKPGYVYYFKSGTGLGTVNALTGVYTAPSVASAGASDTVEVADAAGLKADAVIDILVPASLSILPSNLSIVAKCSYQFEATGGIPPFTWTCSGSGSVDASTGLYTAGASAGSATITLADASLMVSASVTVSSSGALSLSPGNAMVEEGGTVNFVAAGGTPSYTYSLVAPSSGSINGTTGVYTASHLVGTVDTVKVTDTATPPSSAMTSVTVLPARPANLVADGSAGGPTEIALSWTNQASSADGFRIERKLGSTGTYAIVAQVGFGVTTYPDSGLSPNKLYYYRVLAYKGTLDSPYSNEVSALPN